MKQTNQEETTTLNFKGLRKWYGLPLKLWNAQDNDTKNELMQKFWYKKRYLMKGNNTETLLQEIFRSLWR